MIKKLTHIAVQATFLATIIFVILPTIIHVQGLDPVVEAAEKGAKVIKVRQDGSGEFKTVTDAVKSIPDENTVRTIVSIGPGVYKEKITVSRTKHFVTFYGTDPNKMPTLTFDGTAAKYGTLESASVGVESNYFMAVNIIFQNTAPEPDGKRALAQAVAMRISGDRAAFYNCRFIGFQDTLCDDKGSHYFSDCYIEGTVDFIFGRGKSLYLNTELHSVSKGLAALTAHARETEDDDSGFTFVHCKISGTGDIYLGRVWKKRARVVFAYTYMDIHVNPAGWSNMNSNPDNLMYYAEYKCMGPGSSTNKRIKFGKILTDEEAKPYLDKSYINATAWLLPPPKL